MRKVMARSQTLSLYVSLSSISPPLSNYFPSDPGLTSSNYYIEFTVSGFDELVECWKHYYPDLQDRSIEGRFLLYSALGLLG